MTLTRRKQLDRRDAEIAQDLRAKADLAPLILAPHGFIMSFAVVSARPAARLVIDYGDGVEKHFVALPWDEAATVADGLAAMGVSAGSAGESHAIPDLASLPAPVRALFEHAFGDATGWLFLLALPFAVIAFGCLLFIHEVPLRQTILHEDELDAVVAAELGVDQPGGAR